MVLDVRLHAEMLQKDGRYTVRRFDAVLGEGETHSSQPPVLTYTLAFMVHLMSSCWMHTSTFSSPKKFSVLEDGTTLNEESGTLYLIKSLCPYTDDTNTKCGALYERLFFTGWHMRNVFRRDCCCKESETVVSDTKAPL